MAKLSIYMDEEFAVAFKKKAQEQDRSMSYVAKKLLEEYMGRGIRTEKLKVDRAQSQRAVIAAQAEAYSVKPERKVPRVALLMFKDMGSPCMLETCGLRGTQQHPHYADEMTLKDWLTIGGKEERWWEAVGAADVDLEEVGAEEQPAESDEEVEE